MQAEQDRQADRQGQEWDTHDEFDDETVAPEDVLIRLNQIVHAWGNYFRHAVAKHEFHRFGDFLGTVWPCGSRPCITGRGRTSANGSSAPTGPGCRLLRTASS